MIDCGLGMIAFALFFIYDWNSIGIQNRLLHKTFLLACLFLCYATGVQIWKNIGNITFGEDILWLVLAMCFLGLLCYTLFFALPFTKTYGTVAGKAQIYDRGIYALCRHPGVLWFFGLYFCLGMAFSPSDLLGNGMVYSFCNVLYVVFQDVWTFPKLFDGYEQYQNQTPFLLPTIKSIKRAWGSVFVKGNPRGRGKTH